MRFLIMLEQTETGFAVQVPDLAIVTHGENIEAAKRAASEAIRINLEAYQEAGQQVPEKQEASLSRNRSKAWGADAKFTSVIGRLRRIACATKRPIASFMWAN